jgi:hypothetical protein
MVSKERKLMRRGSVNVTQWYCAACAWSEVTVVGKPDEMSTAEVCAAFEKHVCGEKSRKRKGVIQAASRSDVGG